MSEIRLVNKINEIISKNLIIMVLFLAALMVSSWMFIGGFKKKENFSFISSQKELKIDPDYIRKNPEFFPKPDFSRIKSLNF